MVRDREVWREGLRKAMGEGEAHEYRYDGEDTGDAQVG